MYCLICEPLVELKEQALMETAWGFNQYYICPECDTYHVCISQSKDMRQENMDVILL